MRYRTLVRPQAFPAPKQSGPSRSGLSFSSLLLLCLYVFFFKYIIHLRFCNIGIWREVNLRKEMKSWQLSIFQWNYSCEFNIVIVWWMIWCPIYNMGYIWKINKTKNFHIFFYWWHILYDNKTTNLTLQKALTLAHDLR